MLTRRAAFVFALALFPAGPVLAVNPLPAGAVARLGTHGATYRGRPDKLPVLTSDGTWREPGAVSPDGKLAAVISDEHHLRLCRAGTREVVHQLKGHSAYVVAVAFSPDGKTLASGSNDRTVRLWDTDTGREVLCCRGHEDQVCSLAFAPDGKTLASASWDGTARLWDVASGQELRRCEGHRYEVRAVAFSPDGKALASGGTDGTVRLWDAATGEERWRRLAHEDGVDGVAFTKDGKRLGTGDAARTVRVWDALTGTPVNSSMGRLPPLPGATEAPSPDSLYCAAFSTDGKRVALGHADGTVRLHDAATGKELRIVGRHPHIVWSVAFTPDGKAIASAGRRHGVVRLWDVETGRMVRSYPGHAGGVSRILVTPDGKQLVAAGGSFDPTIIVYDVATAKELHRLEGHTNLVDAIALSPDGRLLASAAGNDPVRLWDLAAGKERRRWPGLAENLKRLAFTADGAGLLAADETGNVCVFDLVTGRRRRQLPAGWVGTSPDGRTVAVSADGNGLALVEVLTGRERRRYREGFLRGDWVTFAPDGRRLLSEADNGTALLWDLARGAAGKEAGQPGACWHDLGSADAARAYGSLWRLALAPAESLPFLREKLRPAPAFDTAPLQRWMVDLDDDDFGVREKATRNLERAGEAAWPALQKALSPSHSAEVQRRAEAVLAKLDEGTTSEPELRELRALEVLERIGTPEARQILEKLAGGSPEARLTREARAALERSRRREP
jgi:WD40 repeat protein